MILVELLNLTFEGGPTAGQAQMLNSLHWTADRGSMSCVGVEARLRVDHPLANETPDAPDLPAIFEERNGRTQRLPGRRNRRGLRPSQNPSDEPQAGEAKRCSRMQKAAKKPVPPL
jgi:hypothetical protein